MYSGAYEEAERTYLDNIGKRNHPRTREARSMLGTFLPVWDKARTAAERPGETGEGRDGTGRHPQRLP